MFGRGEYSGARTIKLFYGAMSLSITTHNIMTLKTECHYAERHLCWVLFMLSVIYAECHLCWVSFMLSVIYAECHLCWVSLMSPLCSVSFLQSVVMLNVVALLSPWWLTLERGKLVRMSLLAYSTQVYLLERVHRLRVEQTEGNNNGTKLFILK